ncbi:hydantoinase/oxoprolinase family protein [Alphaproteobacteria bacterium]|nr:hydantoinase/oxoprolinase family protein [Alphaproteobacteria bacterium]
MSYRLGVDVGGTFTDLLLIDEKSGETKTAKVPSTPDDSSRGVLNGIEKVCSDAGVNPRDITHVMHGTTVATNTVLTNAGAKVGLITTEGFGQVLQIARSFVPGGLGGWVIFNKTDPLAPLECTIEASERVGARGDIVKPIDEADLEKKLKVLKNKYDIEALTISFINSFSNPEHERKARKVAKKVFTNIPISISSEVIPELQEYERTETTVVNSYIRPVVSKYIRNLHKEVNKRMKDVQLHVLRSDGGLASVEAAENAPVNLLMSGPAGGVAGAIWIAEKAGHKNLLTFDMGGTSTDVALVQNGQPLKRRETRVADVTVRASSIDVRTCGAGGGSIAYSPELTKSLRVGPQSAGAVPGPAAYDKGGEEPTVTDANVALGYLPSSSKLGGDMVIDAKLAKKSVEKIAKAMDLGVMEAAEGIYNIVNENMFGALRLVSVEQGHDPRDFSLIAFGGAGPLHANALGKLTGAWPVIIPPGPGVLCAYGDATTRIRNEASRSFIRTFPQTNDKEVLKILKELAEIAAKALDAEGVKRSDQTTIYEIDVRYHGQGLVLTIDSDLSKFSKGGLSVISKKFDDMHEQMYTFALDHDHELVNLRAIQQGKPTKVKAENVGKGSGSPTGAIIDTTSIYFDGKSRKANIYDRAQLKSGHKIVGPAIVTEMDSTTLILPDHNGVVDKVGNILINPNKASKTTKAATKKRKVSKAATKKRKVSKAATKKRKTSKKNKSSKSRKR